jgi:protein-tyrosine phosphatase
VASGEPDDFDVVVICSGNRFRSPIAEGVLRGAAAGLPVRVRSLGTLDLREGPVLPEALEFGRSFGLDLSEHRSRRLAEADLSGADLVIGFEPIHVSSAVVDAGARRERTFLLTELVDSLPGVDPPQATTPVERARALVRSADQARTGAGRGAVEEIADPIGGPAAGFRATGERVRELTLRVAEALFR